MPPVVHRHHVAGAPLRPAGVEKPDAFREPALHLQGVHDGVDAPYVARVPLHCRPGGLLGPGVVAGLLQSEAEHAQQRAVVRILLVPGRQRAGDPVAQRGGVPGEEVDLVSDDQRQGVPGPGDGDLAQHGAGPRDVPVQPGGSGGQMRLFACGAGPVVRRGPEARELLAGRGRLALLGAEQPEVRGEDLAQRCTGRQPAQLGDGRTPRHRRGRRAASRRRSRTRWPRRHPRRRCRGRSSPARAGPAARRGGPRRQLRALRARGRRPRRVRQPLPPRAVRRRPAPPRSAGRRPAARRLVRRRPTPRQPVRPPGPPVPWPPSVPSCRPPRVSCVPRARYAAHCRSSRRDRRPHRPGRPSPAAYPVPAAVPRAVPRG